MPAFTSGLGAQLGLAAETTYGTPVTVNRFYEFGNESLKLSRAFLLSQQLRAGRMYQSSTRRTATTRGADGAVTFEVPSQGFGPILNLLHGNVVTPVQQGVTAAYLQTHNIGATDPYTKSVTLQVGRPQDSGTIQAYTYPGCVATSLALSCQTGGFLECTTTVDGNDELTATALAAASLPTNLHSFNFTQCVVAVNSVNQPQAKGFSLTVNTPKKLDRWYLGASTKGVPLTNAFNNAQLTLTVDYSDQTLYNLFNTAAIVPVTVTFTGPLIASTYYEQLTITLAACGLDGETPVVAGPDVLQQQIPLVVLDNGTNPPVAITYQSIDVTL